MSSSSVAVAGRVDDAPKPCRYRLLEMIGNSDCSRIFKAVDTQSPNEDAFVAVKKLVFGASSYEGLAHNALREGALLQEIQHPNIVNLLDVHFTERAMLLAFEYVEDTLKRALDRGVRFHGTALKRLIHQILEGLSHCHLNGMLHRDLKPRRLLLTRDHTVKLSGFVIARERLNCDETFTHEVVTLPYRAPEILLGAKHYTAAIDVWSVGCIFAEVVRDGQHIFYGDSEIDQLFQIFRILGTPNETLWPGVTRLPEHRSVFPQWPAVDLQRCVPGLDSHGVDLLSQLLRYKPEDRITAEAALSHPWFDALRTVSE